MGVDAVPEGGVPDGTSGSDCAGRTIVSGQSALVHHKPALPLVNQIQQRSIRGFRNFRQPSQIASSDITFSPGLSLASPGALPAASIVSPSIPAARSISGFRNFKRAHASTSTLASRTAEPVSAIVPFGNQCVPADDDADPAVPSDHACDRADPHGGQRAIAGGAARAHLPHRRERPT